MNRGDMNAMLAACILGRDRLLRLVTRYGVGRRDERGLRVDGLLRADAARSRSRRSPTASTRHRPHGSTTTRATAAYVCAWRRRWSSRATGSRSTSAGRTPRSRPASTCPFEGSLLVGAYYAVRTLLLDEVTFPEHVPQNDGVFRPVKVIAPKGTIFNPNFPRACFSRFCQVQRVVDNTILALADQLPTQVTAGNSAGIHFCSYSGFLPESGEYWLYLEVNEGSYGGRHGKDAMDSVDNLMANTRNNPIEELDLRFPLRCDQYELRPEPAAPGRWRGGVGIIRRNRFLVDGTFSCEGDRQCDPPRGVFGGWDGLTASTHKNPGTPQEEYLEAKVTGDRVQGGRVHRIPRAERRRLRRSARARSGDRARGRARRLHDGRARPRRLRRRSSSTSASSRSTSRRPSATAQRDPRVAQRPARLARRSLQPGARDGCGRRSARRPRPATARSAWFDGRAGAPSLTSRSRRSPAGVRAGELSALELTEAYLRRIDALDEPLNVYRTVTGE